MWLWLCLKVKELRRSTIQNTFGNYTRVIILCIIRMHLCAFPKNFKENLVQKIWLSIFYIFFVSFHFAIKVPNSKNSIDQMSCTSYPNDIWPNKIEIHLKTKWTSKCHTIFQRNLVHFVIFKTKNRCELRSDPYTYANNVPNKSNHVLIRKDHFFVILVVLIIMSKIILKFQKHDIKVCGSF